MVAYTVERSAPRARGPLQIYGLFFDPRDEVLIVKGLFAVLLVVVLGVAGLGFYQGWFQLSSHNTESKSNVTLSVDQDKIRADEEKVKDKVRELGQKVKETTDSGNRKERVP
jgi:hypothetical protein